MRAAGLARRILRTLLTAVVLYAVWAVLALLWFQLNEGATPSSSALPDLPVGVDAAGEQIACGSGGCSRLYRLTSEAGWEDGELTSLAAQLDGCGLPDLLTLRSVCVYVSINEDNADLSLTYRRPW